MKTPPGVRRAYADVGGLQLHYRQAGAAGAPVLAPSVATRLMMRMVAPVEDQLSAREIEVLHLVARGNSNKEIGKTLHISTATVKTHLIHIYNKLGVSDRTAAVTTALERGIITLSPDG